MLLICLMADTVFGSILFRDNILVPIGYIFMFNLKIRFFWLEAINNKLLKQTAVKQFVVAQACVLDIQINW